VGLTFVELRTFVPDAMVVHPSEHHTDGHGDVRRLILPVPVRHRPPPIVRVLPLQAQRTHGQVEQITLTRCTEAAQNRDELENILGFLPVPPHILGDLHHHRQFTKWDILFQEDVHPGIDLAILPECMFFRCIFSI
jgi:hypothetical protein